MKAGWLTAASLFVLAGCSNTDHRYMPLSKDSQWTYTVQLGFRSTVAEVKTANRIPVGGGEGWRLNGSQGSTSLAWTGSRLVASELSSTRYEPPLTLLDTSLRKDGQRQWDGTMTTAGKSVEAEIILTQSYEKRRVGGQDWNTIRARHEVSFEGKQMEIITWFAPNIGILRQEQRLDGKLTHSLEWLSGP